MIQVAIMGFGTVGSGVAEVLEQNADVIAKRAGDALHIKYILDLREFPDSPFADRIVHDFETIAADPEIRLVAECMGGIGAALNFVRRCLAAGKHVVTSNKELVATHGQELLALAEANNVNFLFEASVGGGIPILRPLTDDLAGNRLSDVYGILNGTTNYILTQMFQNGVAFDDALKQAQALGYAEADPSADVDGPDACRKICILAALAYGRHVMPDQVPTQGIRSITADDTAFASAAGMCVKLIARALRRDDGRVCCYVSPHLLPRSHMLAGVNDVFNGIVVHGNAVDDVLFCGRGAGKLPTASAVVGDLVDCALHLDRRKAIGWAVGGEDVVAPVSELPMRWFVRADAAQTLPGTAIACDIPDQQAVITEPMTRPALDALLAGVRALSVLPVLDM